MKKRIEFWTPQFGPAEKILLAEVIDSGFLNDGELTSRFERQIAQFLGSKHVVATTSGTAAIFLALAALGVGPGDEVVIPDVTFIATANAVCLAGATPVLADVDPRTLTLDPQSAERAITRRTKAIIPVHVSGRGTAVDSALDIAKRHGLLVVEDAAEAFGSRHQGRSLGTFGVAGCFSLSPNKTITTGQGGLVVTDDDRLHTRLRELKDQGRPMRGTGGDDIHERVGYNFKFTDLQAAVGLAQLRDLPHRVERMKNIHLGYRNGLRDVQGVALVPFRIEDGELPQWTDVFVERRDALYDHLASRGMRGRRFWHPLHTQAPYRAPHDRFPNSAQQIPRSMWLPSAFTLSDDDVAAVCGEIRSFAGASKPSVAAADRPAPRLAT